MAMARLTCQAQAQRRVVVQHYSDDDEDEEIQYAGTFLRSGRLEDQGGDSILWFDTVIQMRRGVEFISKTLKRIIEHPEYKLLSPEKLRILVFSVGRNECSVFIKELHKRAIEMNINHLISTCKFVSGSANVGKIREIAEKCTDKYWICVCTNIGGISLTIPGIKWAIDLCETKITVFDPSIGVRCMEKNPTNFNQSEQRIGRAGREFPGYGVRMMTDHQQKLLDKNMIGCQNEEQATAILAHYDLGRKLGKSWEDVRMIWCDETKFEDQCRYAISLLKYFGLGCTVQRCGPDGNLKDYFELNNGRGYRTKRFLYCGKVENIIALWVELYGKRKGAFLWNAILFVVVCSEEAAELLIPVNNLRIKATPTDPNAIFGDHDFMENVKETSKIRKNIVLKARAQLSKLRDDKKVHPYSDLLKKCNFIVAMKYEAPTPAIQRRFCEVFGAQEAKALACVAMFDKILRDILWEARATIREVSSLRLDQKRIPAQKDRLEEDIPQVKIHLEAQLLLEGQKRNFFRMLTDTWVMFLGLRFNRKTSEKRQLFMNLAPFYVKAGAGFHPCTPPVLQLGSDTNLLNSVEFRKTGVITMHFTGAFKFKDHTQMLCPTLMSSTILFDLACVGARELVHWEDGQRKTEEELSKISFPTTELKPFYVMKAIHMLLTVDLAEIQNVLGFVNIGLFGQSERDLLSEQFMLFFIRTLDSRYNRTIDNSRAFCCTDQMLNDCKNVYYKALEELGLFKWKTREQQDNIKDGLRENPSRYYIKDAIETSDAKKGKYKPTEYPAADDKTDDYFGGGNNNGSGTEQWGKALLQLVKEEDDLLAELKQRQQQKRQQKGNLAGATGISTTGAAGTS